MAERASAESRWDGVLVRWKLALRDVPVGIPVPPPMLRTEVLLSGWARACGDPVPADAVVPDPMGWFTGEPPGFPPGFHLELDGTTTESWDINGEPVDLRVRIGFSCCDGHPRRWLSGGYGVGRRISVAGDVKVVTHDEGLGPVRDALASWFSEVVRELSEFGVVDEALFDVFGAGGPCGLSKLWPRIRNPENKADLAMRRSWVRPAWVTHLSSEQAALASVLRGDVLVDHRDIGGKLVLRAPFGPSMADQEQWRDWFTDLAPAIGPLDLDRGIHEGWLRPTFT